MKKRKSGKLKIKIMKKCDCDYDCGGYDYFIFRSKLFQFRFFYDNGYRFLYIHLGTKYWRWDW